MSIKDITITLYFYTVTFTFLLVDICGGGGKKEGRMDWMRREL
jgi:hypothetical protein